MKPRLGSITCAREPWLRGVSTFGLQQKPEYFLNVCKAAVGRRHTCSRFIATTAVLLLPRLHSYISSSHIQAMADETMADGERPFLINDIVYADPEKYHLYDVLIYKYYTAKEVANSPYPQALYEVACIQEELKIPPPRVPWPLPPSSPRE